MGRKNKKFLFRKRREGESRKAYWRAYQRAYQRILYKDPKHRDARNKRRRFLAKDPKRQAINRERNRRWLKDHPGDQVAKNKYQRERRKNPKIRAADNKRLRKLSRTINARYFTMKKRHKKLRTRGITGRLMPLNVYQNKILYADGRIKSCRYCGRKIGETAIGLDRLDNKTGYTSKNTVPCCGDCNAWRGNRHTVAETLAYFKPQRDYQRVRRWASYRR